MKIIQTTLIAGILSVLVFGTFLFIEGFKREYLSGGESQLTLSPNELEVVSTRKLCLLLNEDIRCCSDKFKKKFKEDVIGCQ